MVCVRALAQMGTISQEPVAFLVIVIVPLALDPPQIVSLAIQLVKCPYYLLPILVLLAVILGTYQSVENAFSAHPHVSPA